MKEDWKIFSDLQIQAVVLTESHRNDCKESIMYHMSIAVICTKYKYIQ